MGTLDNLLSGFIGASIGAAASILGGIWAAKMNIKAQNIALTKQDEERKKIKIEALRVSSKVVRSEIMASVIESIRASSGGARGLAIGSAYTEHFKNLIELLSADDLALLYKIYGHIERLKLDFYNYDSNSAFNSLGRNSIEFLKELFGEKYKDILNANLGASEMIEAMKKEYRELMIKLEGF
ncbi:hypothetical protein [Paenibacillus sp. MBLB4367]|uniref:hypothetical protein n=1 Tax=Paenibacillus sp. MBLB4367 TaxID=3384767 RepID=UPI0039080AF2